MSTLLDITKIEEGTYQVSSLPCPHCDKSLILRITGPQLWTYNQGGFITDIFPDMNAGDRERFISGVCPPCWTAMFCMSDEWACDCKEDAVFATEAEYDAHLETHGEEE